MFTYELLCFGKKKNNISIFRIMGLAGNGLQIFGFKGLIRKILRRKGLALRWHFAGFRGGA
jgi:hypothetical protein